MKKFILTIVSVCMVIIGHGQTLQQVENFKKEFLSAWDQNDAHSFDALFFKDSAHKDVIERQLAEWQKMRNDPNGAATIQLQYISKEDYERSVEGDSAEDYTRVDFVFDQASLITKRNFCYNLPIAGVVEITLQRSTAFMVPVGMHDNKLRIAGIRNPTEQERADARLTLAKARHVNTALIGLRGLIGRANRRGQQVSLIVVNRGDNDHLMIDNKQVPKAELKEFILNLNKNCGKNLPIVIVDCGAESKATFEQLDEMLEKFFSSDCVLYNYADSPGLNQAPTPGGPAEQPATGQPATHSDCK